MTDCEKMHYLIKHFLVRKQKVLVKVTQVEDNTCVIQESIYLCIKTENSLEHYQFLIQ
jgi:hypothetical protein